MPDVKYVYSQSQDSGYEWRNDIVHNWTNIVILACHLFACPNHALVPAHNVRMESWHNESKFVIHISLQCNSRVALLVA